MSSLLTLEEKASLTESFGENFDTFSRSITVFKEPIKVIVSTPSVNTVFGYEDNQNTENYTYVPVSGIFDARVIYNRVKKQNDVISAIETKYTQGDCSVKVRQDCLFFIQSGQTEKIGFDNKFWKIVGGPKKQTFLNASLFIYALDEIT
jgi:hypothetical protein